MNPFRINWLVFLMSVPVVTVIAWLNIHAIEGLSVAFWLTLIAVVVGFYPAVNYLFFKVIRDNELSDVLPLLGLIPVLTAFFGWMFLRQQPSVVALVGIISIASSIYCLELKSSRTWYHPFWALATSRSAQAMAIVSIITAAAAIGDKYAIEQSSTAIYMALNTFGAVIVLILCDLWLRNQRTPNIRSELAVLPNNQWRLLGYLGLIQLLAQLSSFAAVNAASNTSYSVAIRNLNIVAASLIALALFHESVNRFKLLSYGLSALGVVMIAL